MTIRLLSTVMAVAALAAGLAVPVLLFPLNRPEKPIINKYVEWHPHRASWWWWWGSFARATVAVAVAVAVETAAVAVALASIRARCRTGDAIEKQPSSPPAAEARRRCSRRFIVFRKPPPTGAAGTPACDGGRCAADAAEAFAAFGRFSFSPFLGTGVRIKKVH